MVPQLKTKAAEMLSEITSFGFYERQNQILLHKYKKQAKDSLSKNPCEFSIVLGAIAMIEKNYDEMHSWFKQAMRISSGAPVSVTNYAASLGFLGLYTDAVNLLSPAYEKNQSELSLLNPLIIDQTLSGDITCAYSSLQTWNQLCSTPHSFAKDLESAVRVLQVGGFCDSDVKSLRQTTLAPLLERNVFIGRESFISDYDENNAWIQYDIVPDLIGESFVEVEEELDNLLESFSSPVLDYVEILYTDPEINTFVEKLQDPVKPSSFYSTTKINDGQMERIAKLVVEC